MGPMPGKTSSVVEGDGPAEDGTVAVHLSAEAAAPLVPVVERKRPRCAESMDDGRHERALLVYERQYPQSVGGLRIDPSGVCRLLDESGDNVAGQPADQPEDIIIACLVTIYPPSPLAPLQEKNALATPGPVGTEDERSTKGDAVIEKSSMVVRAAADGPAADMMQPTVDNNADHLWMGDTLTGQNLRQHQFIADNRIEEPVESVALQ